MIKNIISKTLFCYFVVTTCLCVQEVKAQQESATRELQIVSFNEADNSDDDVRKATNFEGKLKTTALVKVFMPGNIESTDPISSKNIERRLTRSGAYAFYVWIEQHANSMRIVPKGNTYQTIMVDFTEHDIPKYTIKNKYGGLQAGKVYHLVLRDPTPVYIDTHLIGAYATVDNDKQKFYADNDGRITLRNLDSGEHIVNVFASDGSTRGSVKIDDRDKIYTLDARKKTTIKINTNPAGGMINIIDGESREKYDQNKEYAYGSYKVIAMINGNQVEKNITVDERHTSFTINNTKTYTITPMYNGSVTSATVYENNNELVENEEDGVVRIGNTYKVTRSIGETYKYYAVSSSGKSKKTTVKVENNTSADYQLSMSARNSTVWFWQKPYDATPFGVSIGYVQKQMVTKGEGEKYKENGIWNDGENKWLSGMQIGFYAQPCLSWGLGLYTGLFYEFYMSSNGSRNSDEYENFQEHNIVIPVHALYRVPFSRKVALSVHGGLGFSYAVYGAFRADEYEDYTDFYGENAFPKRFNMALEGGIDLRVGSVQVGLLYSKGLNDHGSYSYLGDLKTTYNKIGINVAWVIGND